MPDHRQARWSVSASCLFGDETSGARAARAGSCRIYLLRSVHRTHQFLEQRSQETPVVYREGRASDRLLDRLFQRDHYRGQTHPRSLETLSLGGQTLTPTVTYWRKL